MFTEQWGLHCESQLKPWVSQLHRESWEVCSPALKSYWKVTASGYAYCEPHLGSHKWHSCDDKQILYSGKLLREKTFANFMVLWLFAKVFSAKFGGVVSFSTARASSPQKFCLQKSYFSPICEKFSPSKVSHYTVHQHVLRWSVNFSKGKIVLIVCYSA